MGYWWTSSCGLRILSKAPPFGDMRTIFPLTGFSIAFLSLKQLTHLSFCLMTNSKLPLRCSV